MLLEIALIGVLVYLYCLYLKYNRRNWPPGLFPYPLVGNIIEVATADKIHYIGFLKLAQKYGNIFSLKLGVVDYVVVSGYKEVKEVLTSTQADDRFHEAYLMDRSYGSNKYGLLFSAGNTSKSSRTYALKTLKEFGFGKRNTVDDMLAEEFEDFAQRIKESTKKNNGILKIDLTFNAVLVNIIYGFLTGTRFSQDDPKLQELVVLNNEFFASQTFGGSVLSAYPFLMHWAPELSGFGRTHRANYSMLEYFTNLVDTFRQKGDYKNNPSNFVEVFLQRIEQGSKHNDYDEPIFTDKNLVCILNDLFAAGSETCSHTLSFALRHFVQNPKLQAKIQDEVDRVVGKSRLVRLADRPNLKFTEAFVHEVLRHDTVAPIVARRATSDIKVASYVIPEGTNIMASLYSGNMDKLVWERPEEFRPERFLNVHGDLTNTEKLTTFAFGKRECLGQIIAKNSLVIGVATLAQHFTFKVDPATGMPTNENTNSLTLSPMPFSTLVNIRR